MRLLRYELAYQSPWDCFLKDSNRPTVIHQRGFMEYHADRFIDASFIALDESDQVLGVIPGTLEGTHWSSHAGLTFGGIALAEVAIRQVEGLIEELLKSLKLLGVRSVEYVPTPTMYHRHVDQSDIRALLQRGFRVAGTDLIQAIPLKSDDLPQKKARGAEVAKRRGYRIVDAQDAGPLLALVNDRLQSKYSRKAVHSAQDVHSLQEGVGAAVRVVNLESQGTVVGGAIIFASERVHHLQYLATTQPAKKDRGQDLLVTTLADEAKQTGASFLSFGASTTEAGHELNLPLAEFKEAYGAEHFCQLRLHGALG